MKVTIGHVLLAQESGALTKLTKVEGLPIAKALQLAKMLNAIQTEYQIVYALRGTIIEKFGTKGDVEGQWKLPGCDTEEFKQYLEAIAELHSQEVEIPGEPISVPADLKGFTPSEAIFLDSFVTLEE